MRGLDLSLSRDEAGIAQAGSLTDKMRWELNRAAVCPESHT